MQYIMGIDVGATGTKGAIVDLETGDLQSEKIKLKTPASKKPEDMIEVIDELVKLFEWRGKALGIGFPAIIKKGKAYSASNIHESWIGFPVKKEIAAKTGCDVHTINDADAAGISEMRFGRLKGQNGTSLLLTLGTGIGSALFHNSVLIPNTEFGQLYYKASITEHYASNGARKQKGLSWEEYGKELNAVLEYFDFIFSPEIIVLGGGISKKIELYREFLSDTLNVQPALKFNNAGIIGAAMAYDEYRNKK